MLAALPPPSPSTASPVTSNPKLSPLGIKIVQGLAQSLSTEKIAAQNSITTDTVTRNIRKIETAFKTTKLSEIIEQAIALKIIPENRITTAQATASRYRKRESLEEAYGLNADMQEIIRLYGNGLRGKEIEVAMNRGQTAVFKLRQKAENKLGVHGIDALVSKGLELGLVTEVVQAAPITRGPPKYDIQAIASLLSNMPTQARSSDTTMPPAEMALLQEMARGVRMTELLARYNGAFIQKQLASVRSILDVAGLPEEFILVAAFKQGLLDQTPTIERAQAKLRIMEKFPLTSNEYDRLEEAARAKNPLVFKETFTPSRGDFADDDYAQSGQQALYHLNSSVCKKLGIPLQDDVMKSIGLAIQYLHEQGAWSGESFHQADAWWKELTPRQPKMRPRDAQPTVVPSLQEFTLQQRFHTEAVRAGYINPEGTILNPEDLAGFQKLYFEASFQLREYQIVQALAAQSSSTALAQQLKITESSLQVYISSILKKLGLLPQRNFSSNRQAILDRIRAFEKSSNSGIQGEGQTAERKAKEPVQDKQQGSPNPPQVPDPKITGTIYRPDPTPRPTPGERSNTQKRRKYFSPNDSNKPDPDRTSKLGTNQAAKKKAKESRIKPNDLGNPNLTRQGRADLNAQQRWDEDFKKQGRVLPRTGRINNKPVTRIVSAPQIPQMNATSTPPVTQAISLLRQAPDKVALVRQWRQEGSQLLTSLIGTQYGVEQMVHYGLQGAVLKGLTYGGTALLRTWKTAALLNQVKTPALQANARLTAEAIARMLSAAPVARTNTVDQARAGHQQLQTQVDNLKRLLDARASTEQIQQGLTALAHSIDKQINSLKALVQQTGAGIDQFAKEGARQAMAGLQQLKARVQDPKLTEDLTKLGVAAGTVFLTIALVPLQGLGWVLEKLGGNNSAQGAY